jgi:hypothetical protein
MKRLNRITKTALSSAVASLVLIAPAAFAQQKKPASPPAAPAPAAPLTPDTMPPATAGIYSLDSFGALKTAAQANTAYAAAVDAIMAKGGGVLVIPGSAPANWTFSNNSQHTVRTPAPPEPAKSWGYSPGVTVIDTRGGTVKVYPPQMTGMEIDRTFEMPEGESSPHWSYHPMLDLQNNVVRGSTSYMDYLQEDVKAGKDQRFYVPTIRGLFPGMFLNAHGGPGYRGGVDRLWIKSLGYDPEKKMSYFVADANIDHKKGALLHNKTQVNTIKMETDAHTELQTFDFMNMRHHYSQGDTYLFDARFGYMGDVHSSVGDENGVLYAAFVEGETNIFKSKVQSVNPDKDEVVFSGGNASTLGTGRPLINMNPQKWITGGSVVIVRPASFYETAEERPDLKNPIYQGKSYPTAIRKSPVSGGSELAMGGLIRFSADAPLTPAVVGRYFAIDDKSELVNGSLHRWYLITSLVTNPDGTKDITIRRFWWGAKDAGSPTLYEEDNYTADGHVKPLKYVIAPGSNVYDVSGAVGSDAAKHTLLIAPYADRGSTFDFAAGDAVEQAIGPDPFHPIPLRAWTFDKIPSPFPSPIVDAQNNGVQRDSVIRVEGEDKNGKPAFNNIITVNASSNTVLDVSGKVNGAAIRITPSNGPAPIVWSYDDGRKEAKLNVDNATGNLKFDGGAIYSPGGFTTVGGLSGTSTEAHNLRGINVPVPAQSTSLVVKFPKAEADADYAVFLETNWISLRAITAQTPEGFTVQFATPAPANAKLHWTLIR